MSTEETYGPEDIEQLLLSKDFDALYPEERSYVLRHITDEQEYSAMRHMLLDLNADTSEMPPPAGLKAELLEMHEAQHKTGGFKVWLNSLFLSLQEDLSWRKPALQFASIALILGVSMLVFKSLSPDTDSTDLAEQHEVQSEEKTAPSPSEQSTNQNRPEPAKIAIEDRSKELELEEPIMEKPSEGDSVKESLVIEAIAEAPVGVTEIEDLSFAASSDKVAEYNTEVTDFEEEMSQDDLYFESEMLEEAEISTQEIPVATAPARADNKSVLDEVISNSAYKTEADLPQNNTAVSPALLAHLYTAW